MFETSVAVGFPANGVELLAFSLPNRLKPELSGRMSTNPSLEVIEFQKLLDLQANLLGCTKVKPRKWS
jgi:hypothetical protein